MAIMSESTPEVPRTTKDLAMQFSSVDHARTSIAGTEDTVHVDGVGKSIYVAYEQLRNATEYTEDHLLLRSAIERFLRRTLPFFDEHDQKDGIGDELVSELTQAGYLPNDSIKKSLVKRLEQSILWYMAAFQRSKSMQGVSHEAAITWTVQMASVECENILIPRPREEIFMAFAYRHFLDAIKRHDFWEIDDGWIFRMTVFTASYRVLLRTDNATIRFWFIKMSGRDLRQAKDWVDLNLMVDAISSAPATQKMGRLIRKNGAALLILKNLLLSSPNPSTLLLNKSSLMVAVDAQIVDEYRSVRTKVYRGIIRSILFILLTKMLIGLLIEIPFDLVIAGSVAVIPLAINLIFPIAYMSLIGLSISLPGPENAIAIKKRIETILYTQKPLAYTIRSSKMSTSLRTTFNVLYGLMFLLFFALVSFVLIKLDYNIVHAAIFFLFVSTASFLGFRLAQNVRELVMIDRSEGVLNIVTEFLYTPFIRTGQWIAHKYSKLNVISLFLDIAIELPLKTLLRLMQQWLNFLRDKREEL